MVSLRVLLVLFAGYPLYQDEREQFVCNTIQPGCSNVCHDVFSPVSLLRFWLLQTVSLCVPYAAFALYVVHGTLSGLATGKNNVGVPGDGGAQPWRSACVYVLQLSVQILLEVGFAVSHYFLFGFYVPQSFLCQEAPCTSTVQCYTSKPTEKTAMLGFMLAVSALCLTLDVADLMCAVKRSVRARAKPGKGVGESDSDEDASACLDEPEPSPATRTFPGPESGGPDAGGAQDEVPERDGSQVALCHGNHLRAPQLPPFDRPSHLRPTPSPKPVWGPAGGTDGSKLFTARNTDLRPLEEAAAAQQSDRSETLEGRAWV
ncbi:gap junction delta-4 protein-like [Scleropages formosus]|uniref:Gap junction delta-4 protein-like n=1 Tax=Scleropages formosus TaxID=113540 RepID=A0A0P7UL47_SCLFO|nr:gap junction delta-4 protein-like [Scleropages formosus]